MLLFLKFRDFAWGAEGYNDAQSRQCAADDAEDRRESRGLLHPLGMLALGLVITYAIERSWMGYLVAVGELRTPPANPRRERHAH